MGTGEENASCCRKRTGLEKGLIFGVVFLLVAVVALIVGIFLIRLKGKDDQNEQICYTPGCVQTASNVLGNMNSKIDPCDDFFNFACGNYVSKTVIPDDKASVSTFSAIVDELDISLRTIIENIKDDAPKHALLTKKLYSSCKDEDAIERAGLDKIKSIISSLDGWPVVVGSGWSSGSEWHALAGKLRKLGFSTSSIIDFSVDIDWMDTTKRRIQLDQPSLGIAREFLVEGKANKKVAAYFSYMCKVARIFGASGNVENELEKSLNLEIELAKISLKREDRRNYTTMYNLMRVSEIQRKYTIISDWKGYLQNVLNIPNLLADDEVVNVMVPKFFEKLTPTLQQSLQDPRVIQNYIIWRVVMDSVQVLTKDLRNAQLQFLTEMSGVTERPKRWNECVSITASRLPIAVGSLYVRKHFKEEARTNSQIMVRDIGNEFKGILRTIEWMDEETRAKALQKANAMTNHIAYPDQLTDDKALTDYYSELDFPATSNYLDLNLRRNIFAVNEEYKKLKDPVDKTDWTLHANAAVVNAFYNSIFNSIEFPAGILQGVFFNNDRPRYMNYGAIGFVIGHEITHGFDDQGRQFDKSGNLKEWWNANTKDAFTEKAQCIINQYGNYTVKEIGLKLNGINTQGENIADNGGIKEAYLAYKASTVRDGKEPRLPGLQQYTPEQMFWISAANVWCTKYTNEDLELRVKTGVHSPGMFRVIGPMSNSKDFAEDFKCKPNSAMNPEKKCIVW